MVKNQMLPCGRVTLLLLLAFKSMHANAKEQEDSDLDRLLELSLTELINTPITSTSLFPETSLDAGSTVSVISADYWQKRGARNLDDAVSYMPGFVVLPHFLGVKQWAIRGFSNTNGSGVQTLLDGVSLNTFPVGMAQLDIPNIQLNSLDSIEVIRGPGSAIYGSEAFHGVVSLKTFESDHNMQQASLRIATNGYTDASYKISTEVSENWRMNMALSTSGQPDQDFEYQFDNSGTLSTQERDYNYDLYTTSIKFANENNSQTAYKLGFYYNGYNHEGFYHNGASVPSDDTSNHESQIAMLKGEVVT